MWHTVPVEHLLLLLRSDAIVFVHEVKKWTFGLLERCIGARFEVAQIRENALLELFRILHRSSECLEPERETPDNICTGNVKEIVPIQRQTSYYTQFPGVIATRSAYHNTQDTYSPVGSRNLRMY